MSVPTEYDLTQDALIGPMRDILLTAAEPPTGPEFSYPVVDQAVSSSMWRWITRGQGDGILFAGIRPYWLGNWNNGNNTVEVMVSPQDGTSHAIVAGYFHTLTENKTFTIPMPSSGTITYHICLTYDPRREADPEGPIRLELHAGTPPTTFGRVNVVLWRIIRRANELLTDSTRERVRPGISPVISVNREENLPDPDTLLNGTVHITTWDRGIWVTRATNEDEDSSEWINLQDPPWVSLGLNSFYAPGGSVPTQIQRRGKARRLRGQFRRANQSESLTAGNRWFVTTLPTRDRPYNRVKIPVATSNDTVTATIDIMANGEVYFITPRTVTWATLDGIEYDVE